MKLQPIIPNLWFDGNAEEAANFYVSIFLNSNIVRKTMVPAALNKELGVKKKTGSVQFKFNEAVSFMVHTRTKKKWTITGKNYLQVGRNCPAVG